MRRTLPLFLLAAVGCTTPEKTDTASMDVGDTVQDFDSDGYDSTEDCDDNNSLINPGAVELCDGFDNNCDGNIDEGVTTAYFVDEDGDGFGNPDISTDSCTQPSGHVPNGNDCNDSTDAAFPGATEICDGIDNNCDGNIDEDVTSTWYADTDGDGFGDEAISSDACDQPSGFVADSSDCNDSNDAAFPGATEICDEIDNNCDGSVDEGVTFTWYVDTDADQFGVSDKTTEACTEPTGYTATPGDCDDGASAVNPDATEICDSIDNDCDGDTDEDDAADALTWYEDGDSDGFGNASSTTAACNQPSGYVSDDTDCDDGVGAVNPDATEICDSIDNDCDGDTDEDDAADALTWYEDGDSDGFGDAASTDVACYQPTGFVADDTDCDDGVNAVNPDATEICDSIDNDCDGDTDEDDAADALTWYADADSDGFGDADATSEACSQPSGYVSDDTDCDDGVNAVNPDATEICDSIDNDCDGDTDEDDAADALTWYEDGDSDGFGDTASTDVACSQPSGFVADDTDCDDGDGTVNPDADEYCDSIDNDCDGSTDEDDAVDAEYWYHDDDSDGFGDPDDEVLSCSAPSGYISDDSDCDDTKGTTNPDAAEYCDGEDDDCDGSIDEDDAVDVGTWYVDGDGDGYGSTSSTTSCTIPSGYSTRSDDCDDGDGSINPGESEVCDGVDNDCNGIEDDGVLGTGSACPATDCAEILDDNSSATDGDYELDAGTYYCDMTTDGGGWTLVKDAAYVYGTGYSSSYYNGEGFTWDEALFVYNSGSVHAHCTYPGSMTGCNNLGFQFASENWGVAKNWGSSLCGMSTTDYTSATTYIGGYDFIISRSSSTDTIRLGTLEGIASCTTGDNPGSAYVDIYVRN